ncbi:MAG TPA: cupin [Gammaproteobacteria bacterium]|nr:cupin [Gammaproteobacteria bacterium]
MSVLRVYDEEARVLAGDFNDAGTVAERLAGVGVLFERWETDSTLAPGAGSEVVLAAYREPVERLKAQYGFQSVDVVSLTPDDPQREALRSKFLAEHTHADFEVRFFVAGRGLFFIHAESQVHALLCEAGDLVSVPAGVRHWFDMGAAPDFRCIRFFTTPDGWVAEFTGSDIAARFPDFETFVGSLS